MSYAIISAKEMVWMLSVGISTVGKTVDAALFDAYAAAGIAAMEISQKDYTTFDFAAAAKEAARAGVRLWSLHLPFYPFDAVDISSLDEDLRTRSVQLNADIIRRAAAVGIDKFVIHASGEPIADDKRSERMSRAKKSLAALADVCEKSSVRLCVEDLPRTCLGHSIADMQTLLEDSRLFCCFDTNHITVEKPQDVIRALGARIATLHVSDFDFVNERHWLPGEGKIEWAAVVTALDAIGYDGVWMYEIATACPKTIYRDRDLTCADFRRNACEILNGKAPTVFSRPKVPLGMWE